MVRWSQRYADYAREEVQILEAVKACDFTDQEVVWPDSQCRRSGTTKDGSATSACVVRLFEHFMHELPGCSHPCLALEALGPSLLEVSQTCRGDKLPWDLLHAAVRDSLRGLDLLHRGCNIIHTDIKPENILVRIDTASFSAITDRGPCGKRRRLSGGGFSSGFSGFSNFCFRPKRRLCTGRDVLSLSDDGGVTFVLADLGNSCFADRQVSNCISTCEYKAPEVLLGAGYGTQADLWSLACTLYEAATGRYLFDPRRVLARPIELAAADAAAAASGKRFRLIRGSPDVPVVVEHTAQLVELMGIPPESLLQRSKFAYELLYQESHGGWVLRAMGVPLAELPRCGLRLRLEEHLKGPQVPPLVKLLDAMLCLEPLQRPDARTLLEGTPWLWTDGAS